MRCLSLAQGWSFIPDIALPAEDMAAEDGGYVCLWWFVLCPRCFMPYVASLLVSLCAAGRWPADVLCVLHACFLCLGLPWLLPLLRLPGGCSCSGCLWRACDVTLSNSPVPTLHLARH
jgi:hypothetical protein